MFILVQETLKFDDNHLTTHDEAVEHQIQPWENS